MSLVRSPLGRIRKEAGFPSARLAAERLGVSEVHLSNIERGRQGASEELIAKMAQEYGVEPEKIILAVNKGRKDLLKRWLAEVDTP